MEIKGALLKCDQCGLKYTGGQVTLHGVLGIFSMFHDENSGNIDICSERCFWNWCKKHLPEE